MEKFFTPITFCYDTNCTEVLVPWVQEFEEVINKDANIAILDRQSGEFKRGVYVRQAGFWALALNYEDLCLYIARNSSFKVIQGITAPAVVPADSTVFRNGYLANVTTMDPSPKVLWTLAFPGATGGGTPGGTVLPVTDMFGTPVANFIVA